MIIDSPELRTTVNEIITAKLKFACSFFIFPQHKFYSSWNQYLIHREEKRLINSANHKKSRYFAACKL